MQFQVRVVPMGWSHSVRFVQRGHEHLLRHVAPDAPWLRDGVPSPVVARSQAIRVMYIDNYFALSGSPGESECIVDLALIFNCSEEKYNSGKFFLILPFKCFVNAWS